jgi:hypothetical protein
MIQKIPYSFLSGVFGGRGNVWRKSSHGLGEEGDKRKRNNSRQKGEKAETSASEADRTEKMP